MLSASLVTMSWCNLRL